ncbi:UNVERIFIED_CONTAM: hypothetical protein K2H54_004804 [Gekko kuhli]
MVFSKGQGVCSLQSHVPVRQRPTPSQGQWSQSSQKDEVRNPLRDPQEESPHIHVRFDPPAALSCDQKVGGKNPNSAGWILQIRPVHTKQASGGGLVAFSQKKVEVGVKFGKGRNAERELERYC